MIDIHCHVLPEMDDGSQSLEESLDMCAAAERNGISDIIATPHLKNGEHLEHFIERRDAALHRLNSALESAGIDVTVHAGAEVFARSWLEQARELSPFTLCSSRYMLIEFGFFGSESERIEKYVRLLQSRGITPIIAHPERYDYFLCDPELLEYTGSLGTLFQCNATSLAGVNGEQVRRLATDMVTAGFADFIATDAHSCVHRTTNLMNMIRDFSSEIDDTDIELLCGKHPRYILEDMPFPSRKRGYLAE